MPRANQLIIDHNDEEYTCQPCQRDFKSSIGAINHCRHAQVHSGEWCERCDRLFVSPQAYQSHVDNSSSHNVCDHCLLDWSTYSALQEHKTDEHNQCSECDQIFTSSNNLEQHKRTHLAEEIECFGCNREFREYSGMMIHLESGACQSGIDLNDINSFMFDGQYTDDFRNEWASRLQYTCPDCGNNFRFVSALLQHIESHACDAYIGDAMSDIKSDIVWRI